MDFAFSDEQRMLADQARAYLADKLPPEKVAELADSDDVPGRDSWAALAELGWIGLSAPEDAGGAGMGFLEEIVLFEQMGYGLYLGPYFSTVALALPALQRAPDIARRVTSGEAAGTLAWAEPDGPYLLDELDDVGTKAERDGDGWKLTGTKDLVPDAGAADVVVVAARAADGLGLWAVETGAGATATVANTVDRTRRVGRLVLEGAPAVLLAGPEDVGGVLRSIRLRGLTAAAAEAVGIAQKALDLSKAYAGERRQFDKPIGVYQAVSHQVANTYMDTELARSITYWAAWCVAEGDASAEIAAAAAKASAAPAAVTACERAIQVHGGIGFTWEHVLHRYYKRALWLEAFDGSSPRHRAAIAASLLTR